MLDSLLEAPAHKVGIHLEEQVKGERKDKGDVQAVEAGRAKARRHGACTGCGFRRCTPKLAAIVAFPHNLGLLPIELEYHEAGADSNNDQDDGPNEEAEAHKHVRVVGHADGGQDADRHDCHTDTTVDLSLGVVKEEELAFLEE